MSKMLTVSIDKEFNITSKKTETSIYLRVYTSLFQSEVVKELKPTNFTVLLAIASFMDSDGNCFPTQRQIADITGISTPTVNKAVNELLAYEVNGVPILRREFVQNGNYKNSYYTVNPISQIAIFDGQIKEIETGKESPNKETYTDSVQETYTDPLKNIALNNNQSTISNNNYNHNNGAEAQAFKNSKDVAVYFADKYREQFGVNYSINFRRDLGLIKSKIMGQFTDAQIKAMVDFTISEYDSRWKNNRFPRPTIGSMVSWIGQEALAIAQDREKEQKEIEKVVEESAGINASVASKFGVKLNE